jgi:hypothetical protein
MRSRFEIDYKTAKVLATALTQFIDNVDEFALEAEPKLTEEVELAERFLGRVNSFLVEVEGIEVEDD